MSDLTLTRHGAARLSQRGGRPGDAALIHRFGEEVGPDRYMVTRSCVREAARHAAGPRELTRLDALKGKLVVVREGCLVSFWHAADSPRRLAGLHARRGARPAQAGRVP